MQTSDKYVKLLFAAFIASLLIIFIPLNASAQTSLKPVKEVSTAVSNLDKYLHHVNVTQYGWWQDGYNASNVGFNPYTTAPNTNHILWIGKTRPYEALEATSDPIVVAGKVIVPVSASQSAYGNANGLYAFDQNTGTIIWTYPGLSGGIVLDDQHLLCGTTMINPDTGQFLYNVPVSINRYNPALKMGFRVTANKVQGWDFSDPKNAALMWTSPAYEQVASATLICSNDKVFFGGDKLDPTLRAVDAKTGKVFWEVFTFGGSSENPLSAGHGKVFHTSYSSGITAYDENTGQRLWTFGQRATGITAAHVAYGKVYVLDIDNYFYAFDVNTGGMIWKYKTERKSPFPASGDDGQYRLQGNSIYSRIADNKVYFATLTPHRYGTPLPPHWKSADGTMWNPYDYTVIGQSGTAEFACVEAEIGKLIWKCGVEEIGSPGPFFITCAFADGRLYAIQRTMSSHMGVGEARPLSEYDYDRIINYEWFPPYVYCFGKGPTQFRDITVDKSEVKLGENLTISGKLVDLSPAIDRVSSLSTYKRDTGGPAPRVPVALSFIGAEGTQVPFATVKTDDEGKFSYSWYPWETGPLSIVVESDGSDSYEAPEMTYTVISVNATTLDLVPLLEGALVVAIIAAIALPIIVFILKPKQKVNKP